MRRTNRRHSRAIERHRRSKGSELFSMAADNMLQEKSNSLVNGLAKAIVERGSAAAASLLIEMAESLEWAADPATLQRVISLAEKWSREPQVVPLEVTRPGLAAPPPQPQLTDGGAQPGTASGPAAIDTEPADTGPDNTVQPIDAEFE